MNNGLFLSRTLLLVAVSSWLAACASSPQSRFYTLTPLVPVEKKQSSTVSVNVAPVEIPDYLDRPQIVTRDGKNALVLAEFDRWAGSLGENMSVVLAEDLALLLGTDRVFVNSAASSDEVDCTVTMRVLRLDALPGDHVLLKAQWTVNRPDGKNALTRVSNITKTLDDRSYDTMVAAVNQAIEQLSREIAREISPQ